MFHKRSRVLYVSRIGALAVSLWMVGMLRADQPQDKLAAPIAKGEHVLSLGNSFQVFCIHHLNVMATSAGIKGQPSRRRSPGCQEGGCGCVQSLVQDL